MGGQSGHGQHNKVGPWAEWCMLHAARLHSSIFYSVGRRQQQSHAAGAQSWQESGAKRTAEACRKERYAAVRAAALALCRSMRPGNCSTVQPAALSFDNNVCIQEDGLALCTAPGGCRRAVPSA